MSRQQLIKYLGIAGIAGLVGAQTAFAADGGALPIERIYVDNSKQVVVAFDTNDGKFPAVPHILDLPGPNHRVVVDFTDAVIDRAAIASPEDLSATVGESLPFVKSVRYASITNSEKPTARVVFDLPEDVKVKPSVAKVEGGLVTIALGKDGAAGATAAAASEPQKIAQAPSQSWDWSTGEGSTADADSGAELRPAIGNESQGENPAAQQEATVPEKSAPNKTASTPAQDNDSSQNVESVRLYNSAVQLHLSGKLEEAIAEYKAALKANSKLAEAHSNLGLIYNQQHNYAQALSEFRQALSINPKDAITYNGIGAALRAEKDLLGAIKNWKTAVSLDPQLATAHYNLGTAYEIQKEYDKALESYRQAVGNDYRLGEAYYRMGLIMERKKKPQEAAKQFREALKVSDTSEYSEDARQRLAFLEKDQKKR